MKPSTTITRRSLRRLQHGADQRRDLEAAEGRERSQRRAGIGVQREHFAQHACACAPGRRRRGRCRGRCRHRCPGPASRASSSDAAEVLPMPISPSSSALPGSSRTSAMPLAMACFALRGAHRRPVRRIGRARRDLADDEPVARREVVPHAAVDHRQRQAVLARQHADRRAAGEEVLDHLPGHVARIGRHAARGQAVVARADQHLRRRERRRSRCRGSGRCCRASASSRPSAPSGLVLLSMRRCRRAASAASSMSSTGREVQASCRSGERSTPGSKWVSMWSARPSNTLSSVRAVGAEQRMQHGRIFEQAVQVEPEHVARGVLPGQLVGHDRHRAIAGGRHRGMLRGLAVMDLVAAHGDAGQRGPRAGQRRRSAPRACCTVLSRCEHA